MVAELGRLSQMVGDRLYYQLPTFDFWNPADNLRFLSGITYKLLDDLRDPWDTKVRRVQLESLALKRVVRHGVTLMDFWKR